MLTIALGITFAVIGAILTLTTAIGLPGTWLVIGLAGIADLIQLAWLQDEEPMFGVWAFVIAIVIAAAAELIEFLAGAAGAKAGGATRRGTLGAVVGGFIGGLVGTFTILIPLVGTLVGAALGAAAGALVGELSRDGVTIRDTFRPATGAAAGRVAGTLLKLVFAVAIWIQLVICAFI